MKHALAGVRNQPKLLSEQVRLYPFDSGTAKSYLPVHLRAFFISSTETPLEPLILILAKRDYIMNENPTYYAIIPAKVRYDNSLTLGAKLMYGEITALSNKTGKCWASNQYFARLYDKSKSTISNWIKQLNDANYISILYKRDGKQIKKRIISIQPTEQGVFSQPNRGIQSAEQGYSVNCKENSTRVNNTSTNKNHICVNGCKIYEPLQVEGFKERYESFLAYLKETYRIRAGIQMTESHFRKLIELKQKGNDPLKVIDQTMAAGNKSFYPLKEDFNKEKKNEETAEEISNSVDRLLADRRRIKKLENETSNTG